MPVVILYDGFKGLKSITTQPIDIILLSPLSTDEDGYDMAIDDEFYEISQYLSAGSPPTTQEFHKNTKMAQELLNKAQKMLLRKLNAEKSEFMQKQYKIRQKILKLDDKIKKIDIYDEFDEKMEQINEKINKLKGDDDE